MAFLIGLLLLPACATGLVWYLTSARWAGVLFLIGLIPPIWVAAVVVAIYNDADINDLAVVAPLVIAVVQIVALWIAWYQHDPKGAGQALAVAEGAAAAYHLKNDRPVLGAVTGVSAVAQWQRSSSLPDPGSSPVAPVGAATGVGAAAQRQHSSSLPDPSPSVVAPQQLRSPAVVEFANELRSLSHTYFGGHVTDQQFLSQIEEVVTKAGQALSIEASSAQAQPQQQPTGQ